MSFAQHITQLPRTYDPALGRETAALFCDLQKPVQDLIEGAAGSSPFLKGLLIREREWLLEQFDASDTVMARLLESLPEDCALDCKTALRRAKRRIALWSALCDLAGVWAFEDVTRALTTFADHAVSHALDFGLKQQITRKKLPPWMAEQSSEQLGLFVLAMGKMGASELNYSSDIDLICLFDETRFGKDDFADVRAGFIKAIKAMVQMLNEVTADGYVFRTDLRLRPDSGVTPVCMGVEAAERYYESLGRTWERAAYIKARVCAGDQKAGAHFLHQMQPFVWRKHLDFAAIEDAHNMRLAIRDHKGGGAQIELAGHDMKLGRGGIREIEFFTQTRQLISGGRDPDLRTRQTLTGLERLVQKQWVPSDIAHRLTHHYVAHRTVEHRLQMINDAQTHRLPQSEEGFERVAALMGQDVAHLRREIYQSLTEVHDLCESFFAEKAQSPSQSPFQAPLEDDVQSIVEGWSKYPALRSERAVKIFERLKPEIFSKLGDAGDQRRAVMAFDGFLKGLPAGVQLFSLFEAYPKLIDLMVDIVTISPTLAGYLSRNAKVFDAVIAGSFWEDWPETEILRADLEQNLSLLDGYEDRLDEARRWWKEWHFRIGVHVLRGLLDAETAGQQYAALADATLQGLWPHVQAHFAQKHGPPPGRGAVVLAMGSLGAGALHAMSDLDLIVIYDALDAEMSGGKRSLHPRTYYARLTQALVTALSAQMSEGRLYEVDMRLRPSGNQGPVATSWPAFQSYQAKEAWIWEHLALTRARVIAGPADLHRDVERFRQSLLTSKPFDAVARALGDMRLRIAEAKPDVAKSNVKDGAGRLQDIELLAQLGRLMQGGEKRDVLSGLQALADGRYLQGQEAAFVATAYRFFWSVRVVTVILGMSHTDFEALSSRAKTTLERFTECESVECLLERIQDYAMRVTSLIEQIVPKPVGADDNDER